MKTEMIILDENQQERMTSLEIAEVIGKPHNDIMKAIRKMEPAWEKVSQGKFSLSSRTLVQPNGGTREYPCYVLTKTECLYIATKFNDEARAKLVLRWQELEMQHMTRMLQQHMRLLRATDDEVLAEADAIIADELDHLNRDSDYCYTPTDISRHYGMEGRDLNSFLSDQGIIRWTCGQWQLTPLYQDRGLAENRSFIYHGRNGKRKRRTSLVWTERGRRFITALFDPDHDDDREPEFRPIGQEW